MPPTPDPLPFGYCFDASQTFESTIQEVFEVLLWWLTGANVRLRTDSLFLQLFITLALSPTDRQPGVHIQTGPVPPLNGHKTWSVPAGERGGCWDTWRARGPFWPLTDHHWERERDCDLFMNSQKTVIRFQMIWSVSKIQTLRAEYGYTDINRRVIPSHSRKSHCREPSWQRLKHKYKTGCLDR